MTNVNLTTIFGDRLNINGDQANLQVLQTRLRWAGVESEVTQITSPEQLSNSGADFILLGHGSKAAWASCLEQWPTLALDFIAATGSTLGLAVGSGASRAAETRGDHLTPLVRPVSRFAVDIVDGREILGYKFSEVSPHESKMLGNALLTWLHGPVLAKNPELADQFIRQILAAKGLPMSQSLANENTRKIDKILAGVWKLEKPLR